MEVYRKIVYGRGEDIRVINATAAARSLFEQDAHMYPREASPKRELAGTRGQDPTGLPSHREGLKGYATGQAKDSCCEPTADGSTTSIAVLHKTSDSQDPPSAQGWFVEHVL